MPEAILLVSMTQRYDKVMIKLVKEKDSYKVTHFLKYLFMPNVFIIPGSKMIFLRSFCMLF